MMKKLLVLTAVGVLALSTVGCRCNWWPWRRPAYDPCAPTYSAPCPPAYSGDSCAPCNTPNDITPGPLPYEAVPD